MTNILLGFATVLLLALLGGLVRIVRGPTRQDRMLAAQLFGTTGVGLLLLLAEATARPALRDVALLLVLLAIINAIAFARSQPVEPRGREQS